jgi:antirestriction protein
LGVGGEVNTIFLPQNRVQSSDIEETNDNEGYTIQDYPGLQSNICELFEQLRKRILNLDSSVREEYKKQYIAYKTTTNFGYFEKIMD